MMATAAARHTSLFSTIPSVSPSVRQISRFHVQRQTFMPDFLSFIPTRDRPESSLGRRVVVVDERNISKRTDAASTSRHGLKERPVTETPYKSL